MGRVAKDAAPVPVSAADGGEGARGRSSEQAERTEEWWVGLMYVLGQPSELRRRAAWEAVAGMPEMQGAGLEWADVEVKLRGDNVANETRKGNAGRGARAAQSGGLSGSEVVNALARGTVVDLKGREVVLTRVASVVGVGRTATLRNGTVRGANAAIGDGYALQCEQRAQLHLQDVRVVGTGIACMGHATMALLDASVEDSPDSGIYCTGKGSLVRVEGGRIKEANGHYGLLCDRGGEAQVWDAEVADCRECCVCVIDRGSKVTMGRGRVVGSREHHGVACDAGGQAEMEDVDIVDCQEMGVASLGRGSRVVVRGGRIMGSKVLHGVGCDDGGQAEVQGVTIADCYRCGATARGVGSKVVVHGGRILRTKDGHGVLCESGGEAEVSGVEIVDCAKAGVSC